MYTYMNSDNSRCDFSNNLNNVHLINLKKKLIQDEL